MSFRHIITNWAKKGFEYACHLFPLQDKIVFSNFYGRGLGDDPKYILMELVRRHVNAKYIWLVNDVKIKMPEGVQPIRYASFLSIYHLCTAKVWIDNVKGTCRVRKRTDQFFIQTWHSTLSLKKVEEDAIGLSPDYVVSAKKDSAITDLMYSNNDFRVDKYKHRFWYDGAVVKCDVPRVSVLMNTPVGLKETILSRFNIANNVGIVLYAPTFRQTGERNVYSWPYAKALSALEKKYKKRFVMLLRLHPHVVAQSSFTDYGDAIIDVSQYPDMQELLAISDVLITDFSACMFDFGITRNPVFLFATDFETYICSERGLYFEKEKLPFSMANNVEALLTNIENFDAISYTYRLNLFYEKIGLVDKGNGDKYLADIVVKHLSPYIA